MISQDPSKPLKTLNTSIRAVVPIMMAIMLIHAMTFIALIDFFALKYRQANKKFKRFKSLIVESCLSPCDTLFPFRGWGFDLLEYLFHFKYLIQRIITEKSQHRYVAQLVPDPGSKFFFYFVMTVFNLF